jgi:RimJ/RimL family protein N-acetyltransferase
LNGRSKVRLCPKRLRDAANDYQWQTDPELAGLDASSPLQIKFHQYLMYYADELFTSRRLQRQFAILTLEGEHIGNCAYYGVDEARSEAEIGIMIGNRDYWQKGYGADAVAALIEHVFCNTGLERLHLKTLETNRRAQHCFKRCGFRECGHMIEGGYSFLLMELSRSDWQSGQAGERLD